jgi:alpha-1,3-mannosyltransferase
MIRTLLALALTPVSTLTGRQFAWLVVCVCAAQLCVSAAVVRFVAYTEIDWRAYMQEVEGYLGGELDYEKLRGDTGPLVYPGAFVYLFAALRWATDGGHDVRQAQLLFAALQVGVVGTLCVLARHTRHTPVGALALAALGSRRIQSIFVLRLFNDCWATALSLLSFVLLLRAQRQRAGAAPVALVASAALFSVAVGVKMNVLLFAPALLCVLLLQFGAARTALHLTVCAGVQLLVGAEFLLAAPRSYLVRSFDLGRQFFYIWSVNWQFVPEQLFLAAPFKLALLALHVALLGAFCYARWLPAWRASNGSSDTTLLILFSANLIGVACARSLHYQFYVWYFFSLPFIGAQFAAQRQRQSGGRGGAVAWTLFIAVMLALELAWNVFPPRAALSALMCACHVGLLAITWLSFEGRVAKSKAQ